MYLHLKPYLAPIVSFAFAMFTALPAAYGQPAGPDACDFGAPHPEAPSELQEFAFLIGQYSVAMHMWLGENWSPAQPGVTARWNGSYALGGMAIADEWFNPDPAQDPNAFRGINVRLYDSEAAEWDMMWIDTATRQVTDLRAKVKDGVLTMWQVSPERNGFKAEFYTEDADHWHRVEYTQNDAGEWQPRFKLRASRIACSD